MRGGPQNRNFQVRLYPPTTSLFTVTKILSAIRMMSRAPIQINAVSPKEYKKIKGFEITYGFQTSKFGRCLVGTNENKICHLSFLEEGNAGEHAAIDNLMKEWPKAQIKETTNKVYFDRITSNIFDAKRQNQIEILLKGTDMQVNVWKEIAKIKEGTTITYEDLARNVGNWRAVRAVANAVARNKIAYLIPCHRVIHKRGNVAKYRWGSERKVQLLQEEAGNKL